MDNIFVYILLFLCIFTISFLTGYLILSFIKLTPEEKVVFSFGISFFLLSLLSFIGYLLNVDLYKFNQATLTSILLILIIIAKIKKINFAIPPIFYLHFIYSFYIFSLNSITPIYCGAGWAADWYEHYQRAQFYLYHLDKDIKILDSYSIVARTPLFNLTACFFLSLFGDSFAVYQVISSVLNSAFLLSIYILAKRVINNRAIFILLLLIILNPYFTRMATFTFTKALCCYYIISAIYFYIKTRENIKITHWNNSNLLLSGFLFGCAYLTHQSAIFYLVPIIIDILFVTKSIRISTKIIFGIFLLSILVNLPWHIWAVFNYGMKEIITSTPAIAYERPDTLKEWINQRYLNLQGAFLPVVFIKFLIYNFEYFFTNLDAFLYGYDMVLNYYFGALPGVITTTGIVVLLISLVKLKFVNLINFIKANSLFILIITIGFLADILTVNTRMVNPIGVAQNSMMPLCLILVMYLSNMMSKYDNKIILLLFSFIFLELIITVYTLLCFVILTSYNKLSYIDVNYRFKIENQLVFIYDKIDNLWFIFVILGLFLFVLFIFILRYIGSRSNYNIVIE